MRFCFFLMIFILNVSLVFAQFEIHGHRGTRGWFPENSIPAFQNASTQNVTHLELDLAITADSQIVVSHEPWMHHNRCVECSNNGDFIKLNFAKIVSKRTSKNSSSIYKMKFYDTQKFDCGMTLEHSKFPFQQRMVVTKPLFQAVIDSVKNISSEIFWNIELKTFHKSKFQPPIKTTAKQVVKIIKENQLEKKCLVQSFDKKVLKEIHKLDSTIAIGYLMLWAQNPKKVIKKLGFFPTYWNPNHKTLSQKKVHQAHLAGPKIVPWTVNSPSDLRKMVKFNVSGVITDYPHRAFLSTQNIETNWNNLSVRMLELLKSGKLPQFEIDSLAMADPKSFLNYFESDEQKIGFFLNIYNACNQMLMESNPKTAFHTRFYKKEWIYLAGKLFSLNDIEHGFLRKSKIWWSQGRLNKINISPEERKLRVKKIDPRIHFALNCGQVSCPAIDIYTPENYDSLLEIHTFNYLNSQIKKNEKEWEIPILFKWYKKDFINVSVFLSKYTDYKTQKTKYLRWNDNKELKKYTN